MATKQESRTWKEKIELIGSRSISIRIAGKVGTGKSALLNAIVSHDVYNYVAREDGSFSHRCTTEVTAYKTKKGNVDVTVWDTPGLQDSPITDQVSLSDMKRKCSKVNLTMYCISCFSRRFVCGKQNPDVVAMIQLTKAFGTDFWKNVVIVLTFANAVVLLHPTWRSLSTHKRAETFWGVIHEWTERIKVILKEDVGVPGEIVDSIKIIPAGHYAEQQLHDCEDWLSDLWSECVDAILSIQYTVEPSNPWYTRLFTRGEQLQVAQAEKRATEALCREKEAKQQQQITQRLLEEANQRCEAADKQITESTTHIQDLTHSLDSVQSELQLAGRRLRVAEKRALEAEKKLEEQWTVKRTDIQLTEKELGRGGWGVVKVATFRGIEVAAKLLFEQLTTAYYRHLFIREMNMAACVRHPNLVQFIGATLEGDMIILTELMHTSLRRVLEQGGISREHTVSICMQVCQALNYLHLMQPDPVIHRDISSANVLLDPLPNNCWKAKVTDYGSVNTLQSLKTENPGNPVYSAPEARTPSLQSPKMDIFSVGVLLIEMCTGKFPGEDKRNELLYSIQDKQFIDIIEHCTDKDVANRPTALKLLTELASFSQ